MEPKQYKRTKTIKNEPKHHILETSVMFVLINIPQ
jgi:hypothetical protein